MRHLFCLLICVAVLKSVPAAELPAFITKAKTIAFFGDSITNDGRYIAIIEYHLRLQKLNHIPLMLNLGLPSETCSGLSEPDHPFPRPNVHERLVRGLKKIKPDVVFACYGMNDGIYYPYADKRFRAYQRGVQQIVAKVKKHSRAKLVLMTPPAFDPLPMKKKGKLRPKTANKFAWFGIYEGYDNVLARYAKYVMTVKQGVAAVIDLHTPVNQFLATRRKVDPDYVMSGDGVHVNFDGHQVLARAVLRSWGIKPVSKYNQPLLKLITQRQSVLHASWLSHVGHKRPGVKPGLPLAKARERAELLEKRIRELLKK